MSSELPRPTTCAFRRDGRQFDGRVPDTCRCRHARGLQSVAQAVQYSRNTLGARGAYSSAEDVWFGCATTPRPCERGRCLGVTLDVLILVMEACQDGSRQIRLILTMPVHLKHSAHAHDCEYGLAAYVGRRIGAAMSAQCSNVRWKIWRFNTSSPLGAAMFASMIA